MKLLFKALAALLIMIALLFAISSCAEIQEAVEDCADTSSDCYAAIVDDDNPVDDDNQDDTDQGDDDATTDTPIDDEPGGEPDVIVIIDPPPTFTPVFVLQIDDNVYLSDGTTHEFLATGTISTAGTGLWLINDQLLSLDATPDAITLDPAPTRALVTDTGLYTCVEIDPATAQAAGGQFEYYTEFFIDGLSQGHWVTNQIRCTDIVAADGQVWAIDANGAYHIIEGTATNVLQVIPDRFYIHNRDTINKTVMINDALETYATNWAFTGNQWQQLDGVEYSESGTTWSAGTGLTDINTAMQNFNEWPYPIEPESIFGESPIFLTAGQRDGLLFWIECNSGWVFEYDPTADTVTQRWRLYSGDGMHSTGLIKLGTLSPFLDDNKLYFSEPGAIYVLDIETGFVSVFYSGNGFVTGL